MSRYANPTDDDLRSDQRAFWEEYCALVRKHKMAMAYDSAYATAPEIVDLTEQEVETLCLQGRVYLL